MSINNSEFKNKMKLANYQDQRDAFMSLLKPDCEKAILLFEGPTGVGKTSLISLCKGNVRSSSVTLVPIDFKNSNSSVDEILLLTRSYIGQDSFSNFNARFENLSSSNININHNKIKGSQNQIMVELAADTANQHKLRQLRLTESWFDDIRKLKLPLLMVMDSYEKASTELKEWVCGLFLGRSISVNNLRVVVAGQQVPDANNIVWGHCCEKLLLDGVLKAVHWLPVLEAMNRKTDDKSDLNWLTALCSCFEGKPGSIMKLIEALPNLEKRI